MKNKLDLFKKCLYNNLMNELTKNMKNKPPHIKGALGVSMCTIWLTAQGWTHISRSEPYQDEGFDIVARNSNGETVYIDVKTICAKNGSGFLTKRQRAEGIVILKFCTDKNTNPMKCIAWQKHRGSETYAV